MVLSRLIPVEEFGIVATVQVFLLFFQQLVTGGLGPAIIQNKDLDDEDYGVLFNYSVLFSIFLSIAFGLFGFIIAHLYNNSEYVKLFWLMSVIVLAEGMNVVPTAILNKTLRFRTLNFRLLVCNLIGAAAGTITALLGWGVYALVISVAVPAIMTLIANFFVVKISYSTRLEASVLRKVFSFAKNQLSFTILNYFSRNLDNLLIGKFLGPVPLANYQKSYQLITMPNTVFLGIVSPVLQPVLSQHQDDVKLIRETFMKIVHVLGLIAFPLTAFMVINAEEIIIFLFGRNWFGAVTPLMILAFSIWAQMLTSATGSIFMARNHSQTLLKNGIISTVIILTLTIIGIVSGQVAIVSLCVCIAYVLNFFTSYWMLMNKVLDSSLFEVLRELIVPVLIGLLSAVVTYGANLVFSFSNLFLTLLVRGVLWLLTIGICLVVTGEMKRLKEVL